MGDTLRALNSASKFSQRHACPGSAWAEDGLPELDSPYNAEGSLLHEFDAHPSQDRSGLSEEQRQALNINAAIRLKFISDCRKRLGIPENAEFTEIVEEEFFLNNMEGELVMSHGEPVPGHPDRIIHFPKQRIAIIFDSKFGRRQVPNASLNLQLRCYFVMFLENVDCDTVVAAITQPWLKEPDNLHAVEYQRNDFHQFKMELLEILQRTEDKNAPRIPSEEACWYCKAITDCPVSVNQATAKAVVNVQSMTLDDLEEAMDSVALSERVCAEIRNRLKLVAELNPGLLKKYELGKGQEMRSIPNATKAFHFLMRAGLLKATPQLQHVPYLDLVEYERLPFEEVLTGVDLILSCAKLSLGDLVDLERARAGVTGKLAEINISTALGDLIVKSDKERPLVKKKP